MPRNPTAEQIVTNWSQAMGSGQTQAKYKAGVARVQESPMARAATPQATELYLRRIQESVSNGKRTAALQASSLQQWKDNASNIGAARLMSGAQKGQSKMRTAAQKWAPIYAQVSAEVAAMPKGGLGEAQARSARAIEILMSAAGRT